MNATTINDSASRIRTSLLITGRPTNKPVGRANFQSLRPNFSIIVFSLFGSVARISRSSAFVESSSERDNIDSTFAFKVASLAASCCAKYLDSSPFSFSIKNNNIISNNNSK